MNEQSKHDDMVEHLWRTFLTTGEYEKERHQRYFFRLLPGTRRCKLCYAPFHGAGSPIVKFAYGKRPSNLNPRLCNVCEQFASKFQGGAEVELSLLFADVRGSTNLAETMSPLEYSKLINRFYNTSTQIMIQTDALVDKITGDQVAAMYVPGFAGMAHAQRALGPPRKFCAPQATSAPKGRGFHWAWVFIQEPPLSAQLGLKGAHRTSQY
jgi:adenylate cyclase